VNDFLVSQARTVAWPGHGCGHRVYLGGAPVAAPGNRLVESGCHRLGHSGEVDSDGSGCGVLPVFGLLHYPRAVAVGSLWERGCYLWITLGRKGLPVASKNESSEPGGSLQPLAIKPRIGSAGLGGSRLKN